jgi:hypothetical protein
LRTRDFFAARLRAAVIGELRGPRAGRARIVPNDTPRAARVAGQKPTRALRPQSFFASMSAATR